MVKIRFLSQKVLVVAKAMDFASYFLCLPSGGEFGEIQVDSHKWVYNLSYLLGQAGKCRRRKMAECEKSGELWVYWRTQAPSKRE